jgi:NADH-quinone oxidoreductase subunit E
MATEPQATAEASAVAVPEEVIDLKLLDPILEEFRGQKGAVIPILQRAQELYGYLPQPVMACLSKKTGFPLSRLYGVATFYAQFRLTRRGRHLIRCCDGTACHVRGAAKVIETLEDSIGLEAGATSPDYKYTMEIVYCLGSCGLAPVAVIDDKVHGRLTPDALVAQVATLQ